MSPPHSTEPVGLDKHDPAGMARWLRERSDAAQFFTTMNTAAQRLQFLELWQVNVLPHLAFRFKQAATMVEDLNTKRLQAEHERDALIERVKWLVGMQAAQEDTIGRLNRKLLHPDVPAECNHLPNQAAWCPKCNPVPRKEEP